MKARREALAELPQVRWQQGRRWRYGYLKGQTTETDGSVRVWDNYTGGARSVAATAVQQETRGPRGGRRWEWLQPPPALAAVAPVESPGRPPWRPTEGKAELFNQLGFFVGAAA